VLPQNQNLVIIDEYFDQDNAIRPSIDGPPVLVEKSLQHSSERAKISIAKEGLTVSLTGPVE
jgi:hypothetical protein